MTYYIEDILHLLVDTIGTIEADNGILKSISSQCKKGVGLTDRQYNLVFSKLQNYKDKFVEYNLEIEDNLPTRVPIRQINRDQTIEIVSHGEMLGNNTPYESYKEKWKWIKLRFPFSKKNILAVESISNTNAKNQYFHQRGTHEHYFRLTEKNVYNVVSTFIEKKFKIDEQLIDMYNQIKEFLANQDTISPTVINFKFVNVSDSAKQLVEKDIGELSQNNFLKVVDRKRRYGLPDVKLDKIPAGLVGEIVSRSTTEINIDPNLHSINAIVESVMHLDRFPLLVVLDKEHALEQLAKVYDAFSYVVPTERQTVLFRTENNGKYNVNDFIHEKSLNNWLDSNTDIVYISKSKIPKLLLKTDWKPTAALFLTGTRSHTHLHYYVNDCCDLVMYHDKDSSLVKRIIKTYGYM